MTTALLRGSAFRIVQFGMGAERQMETMLTGFGISTLFAALRDSVQSLFGIGPQNSHFFVHSAPKKGSSTECLDF